MRHLFGDSFTNCASVSYSYKKDAINDKMEVVNMDSTLILNAITLKTTTSMAWIWLRICYFLSLIWLNALLMLVLHFYNSPSFVPHKVTVCE